MFTATEIENVTQALRQALKNGVESGERVLPTGFVFYRVSPKTQLPTKNLGTCYGKDMADQKDVDDMSMMVQCLARAGRANAAGMAIVSRRSILPASQIFCTEADTVAVIYLDRIQGEYEVWYAPVVHRQGKTPTLGEFTQASPSLVEGLPYVLPMDLYGPVGTA
jgi:hypothetical protein